MDDEQAIDYIKTLAKHIEPKYAGRNKRDKDVHDRRFMKIEPKVPEVYQLTNTTFRAPFVNTFHSKAKAMIGSNYPIPKVTPIKVGEEAQKNSTLRENWLFNAYKQMDRKSRFGSVYGQLVDSLVSGGSVWKLGMNLHGWGKIRRTKNEESEKFNLRVDELHKKNFPFYWEYIPRSCFYPIDYDDNGLCEVLIITERETLPVAKQYGLSMNRNKLQRLGDNLDPNFNKMPETVKVYEWWNRTDQVKIVDDIVVENIQHPYERPPYFYAPANVSESTDVNDQGIALSQSILSSQDLFDSLMSMYVNLTYITAFAGLKFTAKSEDAIPLQDDGLEVIWKPGVGIKAPAGWDIDFLRPPEIGPALLTTIGNIKSIIDDVSLAPVLSASAPSADTSNAALVTLIAIAKSIFGEALNNFARAFDDMGSFMFWCIENIIKEDVPVSSYVKKGDTEVQSWLSMGAKDVDGYYEVSHKLVPLIPAEQQQRQVMLSDAQQRGIVAKKRVREDGMGFENPEVIEDEVLIEQLEARPEFLGPLLAAWSEWIQSQQPIQPNMGTPENMTLGVGSSTGVPQMAGVQQPIMAGGPMAAPPPGT